MDFNVLVSLEEAMLCNQKSMSWRKGRRGNSLLLVALAHRGQWQQWTADGKFEALGVLPNTCAT